MPRQASGSRSRWESVQLWSPTVAAGAAVVTMAIALYTVVNMDFPTRDPSPPDSEPLPPYSEYSPILEPSAGALDDFDGTMEERVTRIRPSLDDIDDTLEERLMRARQSLDDFASLRI